ncbi:serine hydrolase domain-containing protein [Sphingomonas lenta]|uniref:Penicillin-binding protein n=1 Tax=Sphingomonas lenta TaxID=1141887 RepID=A0A2A2SBF6_9SPHN|nr:serine hydrolase domain-containing protein [Sphingomonas lenta]PAX06587.1 penicillin-binding protein [Sphingomonas lenta]
MRSLAIVLALTGLAVPVVPAAAQEQAPKDAGYAQLDPIFAEFQRENHIPGLVYGVVADGRLAHVRAFGVQDLKARRPVTPDSLFRIASMTKAFTALAVLSLRDRGRLSLDAPIETYVPELRGWRYPTADSPRIRVRDLLHHTAGFVTDDPWGDRQTPMPEGEFTRMLKVGVPFTRPPGLRMEYSNFGYALLGRVVANASGVPYRTYVERTLLAPLGMRSSGFEVTEQPPERRAIGYRWENGAWAEEPTMRHGAFGAMGGLQTSANDYARYVAWLLAAWPARDGADAGPVKRATIRELMQGSNFAEQRERTLDERPCPQSVAYGMGMRVFTDCELGTALNHGGGYPGYGSGVLLLPEHGVGLFVFSNRTYAGGSEALWRAASMLMKAGLLRDRPQPMSPALADAYAAARTMYARGDVLAARGKLADNFLLDRSAENWRREIASIKAQVGACAGEMPPFPRSALSANFRWVCERGTVDGFLLLAPTDPPTIQHLRLSPTPPPPD